jgi:hypothetical protein
MLNSKLLILSEGKLLGPFENQKMVTAFLDNHPTIRDNCETYTLREVPPTEHATADRAPEWGERTTIRAAA